MSSPENAPSAGLIRRASLAGFFGTAVEAYDFMVFTFLIAYLSPPKFFPSDDPTTGILSSLAVLAPDSSHARSEASPSVESGGTATVVDSR